MTRCRSHLNAARALAVVAAQPALTGDILSNWTAVKMPPPLRTVKIDAGKSALLLLDFDTNTCNAEKRPHCFATSPGLATFLANARSRGVTVAYSTVQAGSIADVPGGLAAQPDDRVVRTVIVTGT
jgi:hypothetical protein